MSTQMILTLAIFILMVLGFLQGKISRTVVALSAMVLLVLTNCLDAKTALSGFSNSNTILMACMFVISEGFSRTQAVKRVASLVNKFSKGSTAVVMLGYCVITMLLANVAGSSSAAFAIMFPMVFAICDEMGIAPSKMMLPIGIISIATIGVLPIGGSASMFATYNGYLESYGVTEYSFKLFDMTLARFPSAIALILFCAVATPKLLPSYPQIDASADSGKKVKERAALGKMQEAAGWLIFIFVIIGMLLSDKIGVSAWLITLIGALLMTIFGVLNAKEVYAAATMGGIVAMYVGVLAMGNALSATGAGQLIGDAIASVLGKVHNQYLLGACFYLFPFILTQFMNNRAVDNIFMPITIMTCISLGCNPIAPMILSNAGALTSFMTPMATATVNMYMGLGSYSQKDLIVHGILPAVLLCLVNTLWAVSIFPLY